MNRDAAKPSRTEFVQSCLVFGGDGPPLAMDQVEPAQPKRGFCQKTCIEFSRRNAALREALAPESPRLPDGLQLMPSMAASWLAWCSVTSADTSSSNASPAMTFSSL